MPPLSRLAFAPPRFLRGLPLALAALLATAQPAEPLRQRILALDPERVRAAELDELLAQVPAPPILLFEGSVAADMESFGAFLQRMGYPAAQLRGAASDRYSQGARWSGCRCEDCERLAARIEAQQRSGAPAPMLIGHSGGGVAVSRILYALAEPAVASPDHGAAVSFAATLATGALLRIVPGFPGCSTDVARLGLVPASVRQFSGYRIAGDPLTSIMGFGDYRAIDPSRTELRNIRLSDRVSHVAAFEVDGYAEHATLRAWIDAWTPDGREAPPVVEGLDLANLPHVADLWFHIKKHRLLQAKRWLLQPQRAGGQ